jgi:hypothetical protein
MKIGYKSNRMEDFEIPVWVLPGLGYQAQNFIEGIGEEVGM